MHKTTEILKVPNQPSSKRYRNLFFKAGQSLALLTIMIFLAGHENINPLIGKSHVDFYASNTKELLRIQSNSMLDNFVVDSSDDIAIHVNHLVAELYKERDYSPIWTINYSTTSHFECLLDFLDSAKVYGFPEDYFNLELLKKYNTNIKSVAPGNEDLNKRIELEIQASRSAFLLLIYLNQGITIVKADSAYFDFITALPTKLNSSFEQNKFKETALSVQPNMDAYHNLINSFPSLLSVIDQVNSITQSEINDTLLAKAMYYAGIIKNNAFDSINTRETALNTLHEKYKIPDNDTLNDTTASKLSNLLKYRYYQVCLNLDRLRKLENNDSDYLLVNIPEFKLHVVEKNKLKEQYNVMVGKTRTPTPIITGEIEKIIATPFWTVPRNIARNEMLYRIRTDSTYLLRNGYYIINNREQTIESDSVDWSTNDPLGKKLWIRQINSRANALGSVKFMFPNEYNVYLHDTPSKKLFSKEKRAFSHGCVRLQNPEKLAQYLTNKLYTSSKNAADITAVIKSRNRKVYELDKTIAIHIQYLTSMGDENGILYFYQDIYKKDNEAINSLFPVNLSM